jgi:hypothetical protein
LFQSAGVFAFLPAFQKAESFSKSRLATKKPSHFQKAGKVLASSPV